jgi:hypothetical protein
MPVFVIGGRAVEEVMLDTWGHLAPEPGKRYTGTMLYAVSAFGGDGSCLVDAEFDGLNSSPWFYDDMHAFWNMRELSDPGLYRWTGTYVSFKNGNHRFAGTVRRVWKIAR